MGSLLLLIAVILIFRALFSSFGFTSSDNERNKALDEFLENKFGSDVNNKEIKLSKSHYGWSLDWGFYFFEAHYINCIL